MLRLQRNSEYDKIFEAQTCFSSMISVFRLSSEVVFEGESLVNLHHPYLFIISEHFERHPLYVGVPECALLLDCPPGVSLFIEPLHVLFEQGLCVLLEVGVSNLHGGTKFLVETSVGAHLEPVASIMAR